MLCLQASVLAVYRNLFRHEGPWAHSEDNIAVAAVGQARKTTLPNADIMLLHDQIGIQGLVKVWVRH